MATQCQVILTLAHLLQQHSLSYDDEKNILLNTSVKCATEMANQGNNGATSDDDGDVHMVLTGSPRPTFAETNAWLLEGQATAAAAEQQRKASADAASGGGEGVVVGAAISKKSSESFRGSYSIADNNVEVVTEAEADAIVAEEEAEEGEGDGGGAQLLQEYIAECTHNSSTKNANMDDLGGSPSRIGGSVLNRFSERKYSHEDASAGGVGSEERGNSASGDDDDDAVHVGEFDSGNSEKNLDDTAQKNNNNNNDATVENSNGKEESADDEIDNSQHSKGPMVGHAVVNAVSQQQGVGLQSSCAQLLQGTIDRPLWD